MRGAFLNWRLAVKGIQNASSSGFIVGFLQEWHSNDGEFGTRIITV